jgi:hypothetical protein
MAVAVVRRGVTPLETEIFGVTVPEARSLPVPVSAVPMPKCVTVSVPPVAAGKSMLAAGLTEFPVTVQPDPERATDTRA